MVPQAAVRTSLCWVTATMPIRVSARVRVNHSRGGRSGRDGRRPAEGRTDRRIGRAAARAADDQRRGDGVMPGRDGLAREQAHQEADRMLTDHLDVLVHARQRRGLLLALREARYRSPEDQAVIGFDDAPEGEQQDPPLSSVNQHVEVVGVEAVRLLVRQLAGDAVAPGHHPVPTSLVARGSCGCTPDAPVPVGPGLGRAPAVPADLPPREWLTRTLAEGPMGILAVAQESDVLTAACVTIADAVVDPDRGPRTATELYAAVETIYRHHPRGETITAVASAVQEAARRLVAQASDPEQVRARVDERVREIALAFGTVRTRDQTLTTTHLQVALRHEYDISMELLHGQRSDPAALEWLRHAPVQAGCLALWAVGTDPRALKIVSMFGAGVGSPDLRQVRPEEFPPPELIHVVGSRPGTQVVVLPIKTDQVDWGMLAVVGPPEAASRPHE